MKKTSVSDSRFVTALAEQASQSAIAAPATLTSLKALLLTYLPEEQVSSINSAYDYAFHAHDGQFRRTGHAYITHPLAVAQILAEMRMDHSTIMAALLHDVIEDSRIAKSTLGSRFGEPVAEIVDGVSKLSTIFQSRAEAQAENFQKMALAMAKDIRVIMVKLADRLHNMRTIGVMSDEQRRRIARETLDYYAPIANRLGMNAVKVEFEELGFHALYPLRADRIGRAVAKIRGNRKALLEDIATSIQASLNREGIAATVQSREKHLFSIYRKMKSQHKSFKDIMDMFGFRVVVEQEDACYRTLGIVHSLYKPVAGRFKDYIAIPKVNGYQSLHTTLFGMHGIPIEVQIRTKQMDQVAEYGIAGHWLYKAEEDPMQGNRRTRQWLKDLLDLQRRAGNPLEFIENLKVDLFPDEVYVFTPKGDIMSLVRGSSAVDFAYSVHTDVGNQCVACRIDRTLAPLSQQLQSGQSVEIITSAEARPQPDWLTFVVTSKARAGIRHALKSQLQTESIALGRKLLNQSLRHAQTSINDLDFRRLRRVFKEFGVKKLNELLSAIGNGALMSYVVAQHLLAADNPDYEAVPVEHAGPMALGGGEGLVINYSRCCGPVPGDAIVGHMTPGKGFVVHTETCRNMAEIRRRTPREIIPARWTKTTEGEFLTNLRIEVAHKKGVIAEIALAITDADAGLERINVEERNAQLSSIVVVTSVMNRDHLAKVMRRVRSVADVVSINRISV